MATAKSSVKPESPTPQGALPAAVGLVTKIRGYSWGALLGVGAAGMFSLALPTVQEQPWLELPLASLCVAAGMLVERIVNYFLGRQVDSWVQHRAARFEANRELAKLGEYRANGTLDERDARDIATRAAKRDILGGKKPGTRRGPYKKKSSAPKAPDPSQPVLAPPAQPAKPPRPAA